jgi:oxygen-independent coproporphyrinogen-3 oxidase
MSTPSRPQLLSKYDVPGPRYTSYPTVPYWAHQPTADQWLTSLAQPGVTRRGTPAGAGIYVHVPFCESLCTYCGCNTRITRNHELGHRYVDVVLQEWELYRRRLSPENQLPLAELHFGGGTPTFLEPPHLRRLAAGILAGGRVIPGAELSLEADPRVTTRAHLEALAELGFNRLSLGIQDFDPRVQDAVHREQSEELVQAVVQHARELGYQSLNFDLIYGLPFQSEDSIRNTVAAVTRLNPDRLAFYGYAHVPWIKPQQRKFTEADLPTGEAKRHLYEVGRELLEAAGFREIGMDHFAKETDSLWLAAQQDNLHRNFMGYTARPVLPLIGLGVSAIGDSWNYFAQNEKVLEPYMQRVLAGELPLVRGHTLTAEDLVLRQHILNLMTAFSTRWTEPDLQSPFLELAHLRLRELAADGLVELQDQGCTVTPLGRTFLRNICMALDARLARQAPPERLFSRAV